MRTWEPCAKEPADEQSSQAGENLKENPLSPPYAPPQTRPQPSKVAAHGQDITEVTVATKSAVLVNSQVRSSCHLVTTDTTRAQTS